MHIVRKHDGTHVEAIRFDGDASVPEIAALNLRPLDGTSSLLVRKPDGRHWRLDPGGYVQTHADGSLEVLREKDVTHISAAPAHQRPGLAARVLNLFRSK